MIFVPEGLAVGSIRLVQKLRRRRAGLCTSDATEEG
jgi:hypothetical protein